MHRSDIDGLRAIAVSSVVFFHLGFWPERIGGGFVGVDVFFVISGYLITGILQAEVEAGKLSLIEFYHRRVRRIFPALFVVYLFCLIGSAVLLFSAEARDVGRDVLWSLGFLSNVSFSRAGGYFDQASKAAPLLHTWSLSVEEQFYIVLPLILWALSRVRPWLRIAILGALAGLSFVLCERMVAVEARRAFYLVQYRAWELLLGSLLALGALPRVRQRTVLELIGGAGLGLILFAVFAMRSSTPFPGLWALPPCLGALAILYSGRDARTYTSRLLGCAPLRWIGLISYSMYLWHWPLMALYNARHDEIGEPIRLLMLAFTVVLSVLSYRFVETPFRTKPYRFGARSMLGIAAICMLSMAGLTIGIPAAAARLRPHSELADAALAYTKYAVPFDPKLKSCFLNSGFDDLALFQKDVCLEVVPARKNFLIMGDSHAAHFVPAFADLHPEIHLLQATASGCQAAHHDVGAKRCTRLFSYVFDEFLPKHHLDAIFLAGRWPPSSLAALEKTVSYLRPFADRVVVLGPVVEYDQLFPQLLARSITDNDPTLPARHLVPRQRSSDRQYAARLAQSGAEYYSVYDATCPNAQCTLWAAPTVPMQYDEHHLTLRGSELVLDRLGARLFR